MVNLLGRVCTNLGEADCPALKTSLVGRQHNPRKWIVRNGWVKMSWGCLWNHQRVSGDTYQWDLGLKGWVDLASGQAGQEWSKQRAWCERAWVALGGRCWCRSLLEWGQCGHRNPALVTLPGCITLHGGYTFSYMILQTFSSKCRGEECLCLGTDGRITEGRISSWSFFPGTLSE